MKRKTARLLAIAAFITAPLVAAPGVALAQTNVPSCYAAARLDVSPPPAQKAVFVLIDQTTSLDGELRRTIADNLENLLTNGTTFKIAKFSAFSRGHHTTVISSGTIESPVPRDVRPTLPVNRLNALDRCLVRQRGYGRQVAARALAQAMNVPATNFSNSEIMASLTQLSATVRTTAAPNRIVIVGSDLMEHSSAASFYQQRRLRNIDVSAEMRNAARLSLFGNFGGARVYVVGTGLLPGHEGNAVRDISALNSLIKFWATWFRQSRAGVTVIGRPNLVTVVR